MNKKKLEIVIFIIIFLLFAIFTFVRISLNLKHEDAQYISDKVTDECVEEYYEELAKVNSIEERISPNCLITLKKYYKKCEHTINEYLDVTQDLVNLTEKELKNKYKDWEIIGFSKNEVVLYREIDEICDEHYILKDENGKIVIYNNKDGKDEIYEKTNINTEYLTETDLIKIQNGFEVYGKEELNKVLEDFE